MAKQNLEDPVKGATIEAEEMPEIKAEDIEMVSIDDLTLEDFKPVPVPRSTPSDVFAGYPHKKLKLGEYAERGKKKEIVVRQTDIVMLDSSVYVAQDPTTENLDHKTKSGEMVSQTIPTTHSVVVNYRSRNYDIDFGRILKLKDGSVIRIAIVPQPEVRCQLCWEIDPNNGQVKRITKYRLLDTNQLNRLKRIFDSIYKQSTAANVKKHEALRFEDEG